MPSDSELDRLDERITRLCQSMDRGFERVHRDLIDVKRDLKELHKEAIPHRVNNLEKWRDRLSGRLWTFLIGTGATSLAAWVSVLVIK